MAIAINNYNTTQDKSDLSVGQCGLFLARKMAYDAEMAILAALSNRVRTLDFINYLVRFLQDSCDMRGESDQEIQFQW